MYYANIQNYPSQGLSGLEITLRPVSCTVFPRVLYCTSWDEVGAVGAAGTAEALVVMSVTIQVVQPRCPLLHRPLQVEDIRDVSAVCWALSRLEDKQSKYLAGELIGDLWLAPTEHAIQ